MKTSIPIGMLFSSEGPYRTVSRAMRDGALLAVDEVNADKRFDFELQLYTQDPKGVMEGYLDCAQHLLRDFGIKHIIGCYTSSSRKEVIPSFEKYDALLWYPSHYEGFETNDNVIYTGAAPNHHVLPLLYYVFEHIGKRIYCIGSNYVWAWENNRIVRDLALINNGQIVGERYLQLNDLEVGRIIQEIIDTRPDFILNTLIGESSYIFYRGFSAAREKYSSLQNTIVGSCTLCEPELVEIGRRNCGGYLSSSVYFSSIPTPENQDFKDALHRRFGASQMPSADAEASYNTIHLMSRALAGVEYANIDSVKSNLYDVNLHAPQGRVFIDKENNHCFLTPRIGISKSDSTFEIIRESSRPVRPDPYLVWVQEYDLGFSESKTVPGASASSTSSTLRVVK